jgi:hypothetical protein
LLSVICYLLSFFSFSFSFSFFLSFFSFFLSFFLFFFFFFLISPFPYFPILVSSHVLVALEKQAALTGSNEFSHATKDLHLSADKTPSATTPQPQQQPQQQPEKESDLPAPSKREFFIATASHFATGNRGAEYFRALGIRVIDEKLAGLSRPAFFRLYAESLGCMLLLRLVLNSFTRFFSTI